MEGSQTFYARRTAEVDSGTSRCSPLDPERLVSLSEVCVAKKAFANQFWRGLLNRKVIKLKRARSPHQVMFGSSACGLQR